MNVSENNKQYLGLNDEQYRWHCRLMAQKMYAWPSDLWRYVQEVTGRVGASGDVIARAVADWIKSVA